MWYNYLLGGLNDLQVNGKQELSREELMLQLQDQLTAHDLELLEQICQTPESMEIPVDEDGEREETLLSEADYKVQLFYNQAMKSKNKFVRDWYEFNLNLNNVLAATICRKHGFDINKTIVGENEVAQTLREHASEKDFGLSAILPELGEIMVIVETEDLKEREKKIDALRWQWLEEHTMFNHFEIENVLVYWLQSEILHRWDKLTMEEGQRVFRELVADMKKDVKF